MNELLAKFRQLDAKTRTIGLGVVLSMIFLLDFLLVIRPQFSHFVKLGKDIKELRSNIDVTLRAAERAQFLRSEKEEAKKKILELQEGLTSPEEMTVVLHRISSLAGQHHIKIIRIAPEGHDFEVLYEKDDRKYLALSVVLEADGGYHDFGRFVDGLEKDAFFIRLKYFSLMESQAGRSKITMTLKALMFEGSKAVFEETSVPEEHI